MACGIGRAPQLVGDGLYGHHRVGFGRFPLIEAPNLRIVAHCEVGRFHERPRQILIAVLRVASSFGLAVAQPLAADAAAVGRVVACPLGKRPMSPVSNRMVVARMSPTPATVFRARNPPVDVFESHTPDVVRARRPPGGALGAGLAPTEASHARPKRAPTAVTRDIPRSASAHRPARAASRTAGGYRRACGAGTGSPAAAGASIAASDAARWPGRRRGAPSRTQRS
jgi:hypothetical protein